MGQRPGGSCPVPRPRPRDRGGASRNPLDTARLEAADSDVFLASVQEQERFHRAQPHPPTIATDAGGAGWLNLRLHGEALGHTNDAEELLIDWDQRVGEARAASTRPPPRTGVAWCSSAHRAVRGRVGLVRRQGARRGRPRGPRPGRTGPASGRVSTTGTSGPLRPGPGLPCSRWRTRPRPRAEPPWERCPRSRSERVGPSGGRGRHLAARAALADVERAL